MTLFDATNSYTRASLADLPPLEQVIDSSSLVVAPDTLLTEVISLMSQFRGSNCSLSFSDSLQNFIPENLQQSSCVVVVAQRQLLGIFTERDIVKQIANGKNLSQLTVAEVMIREVITLTQSDSQNAFTALELLQQHGIRHLPILDEQGQLLGIVTYDSIRSCLQPATLLKIRRVGEVMSTQVIHAQKSVSVISLARLMTEHKVSCVVIASTRSDISQLNPVGIITERDIVQFQALELNIEAIQAETVMSSPLFCLSPQDSLWDAHKYMQARRVHRLVVTGEKGELLGVVTQTNLLQLLNPMDMASAIAILQQEVEAKTAKLTEVNQNLQQEIAKRQQLEVSLKVTNDDLEQRVQQRTAELEEANRLLQQEIQERQQTELALRESEAKLNDILNSALREGILLQDANGSIYDCNASAEKILGRTREQIMGRTPYDPIWQAIHEDGSPFSSETHPTMVTLRTREPTTNVVMGIYKPNDEIGWILINAQPLFQPGETSPYAVITSFSDITRRKEAETSLRESEFSYRTLAENLPAIVYRIFPTENNRIVFFNNMLQILLGYECEDLERGEVCSIEHFIIPEDKARVITTVQDAIAKNQPFEIEYRLRDRAGEIHYFWEQGKPIHNVDGQILQIDGVIFDITDKKQLEQQFYRTQRLESLGTLSSGIAHDLNNILTPILAVAQLLPLKLKNLDEHSRELLKMQEVNSKRAADLVRQILSFARGTEGERSFVQIKQLLLDIERIAKSTFPKSIEITTHIANNLFAVFADGSQLHQILMNLLVNARDAMPDGGTVTITANNLFIDETYAKMNIEAKVGDYVVITVTDTGIGISQEIIERIFDPFFTTKDLGKGTGLGLSSAIGIVKNHGGFMTVRSEVGKGSRFQVYLPARNDTISKVPEDQEMPTGGGELILLVDDEVVIVETTKATLENYNYRVLTASDGIDAIAIYAQSKNKISVAIIDMMMPSMDGENTIRTLQKLNPQVQIIAMSGLTSTEMMAKAARAGVKQFLAKPFTAEELLNCLHSLLNQK